MKMFLPVMTAKKIILHPQHLRDIIIDRLAYSSQFSEPHTREEAQKLIWDIGLARMVHTQHQFKTV